PKASISFGREYISGGMLDTVTVVFSEKMIPTPTINLFFGQDSISGQMDVSQASDSIWTFEFIAPDGINNNGMVTARFSTSTAVDYAGNNLGGSDSIAYPDTLYIENIVPQATFTYANKSDTTLSNIGIGEQNILITVKMNELISITTPVPSIDYWYANGVASIGDTVQVVLADSIVGDTAFYFNIVLADGEINDGPFHTNFTAKDRPGNVVESFVSTDLFQVDNIHPADFLTGTVNVHGKNPKQGWLNGITDSIEVKLPISAPSTDSTLYQGGRVDIQLYNITSGTQWKTIVLNNTVENDSITNPGDSVKFYRSFAKILEKFPDGTDLYLGDSLKVRGKITDRNGNSTFGTESTYKYVYDPTPPIVGTATGGNFITFDTLISSDLLSIQWSEFTDFGDAEFHSGTERYEYAIEKTVSPTDSINNFYNWDTVPLPNEPYELTFFLKHDETYVAHIRAFDLAGNISDTLHADTLVRYNSNPVIAPVLAVSLSEDIPWNNLDSVIVSDLDLATMQSDSFRYRIITTRTIGNAATSNVATIDSIGRMSWVPTQDDTGFYNMKVIVEDNYLLIDSVVFALSVAAVNDTPVVNIVAPDHIKEWIEDAVDTTKINLTSYLIDVDNNDSTEMSWAAIILDTTQLDEDYPLGQVIVGPGTPWNVHAKLAREYLGFNPNRIERKAGPALSKRTVNSINNSRSNSLMSVKIDTASSGENWAYFTSAPNYYGTNHRVIFIVHDIEGAEARDTVIAIVSPKNDPPVISEIPLIEVIENDSIKIDFGAFTYDVDDTSLTFTISAITNEDKITISPMTFLSNNVGDSVQFIPSKLWSADATIQVIAADEEASDTATFTLDVLRVLRPHPSVAVVQNNAFTKFIQVIITDTVSKTTNISLEIQNEDIDIDTIAAYTWSGDFNFDVSGTYSIDVHAIAHVGDTLISEAFSLAAAKTSSRWSGRSGDGRFSVVGDPGAVAYDQPFLIVDSSLFSPNFNDQASYVLGDEGFQFVKPIEIRFGRDREDLAIYRRKNGVIWEELPSITKDENIFTLSEKTGYFKLGPKTIIVPEETNIHQNYPNPFNPITTIIYDIGLMDGLSQNVSINIYNLLGQHVKTLVENKDQIGQFRIQWNGQNKRGEAMSSGIYFVQLSTNTGVVKNKKMMLLK
ncbi:MAG: FlgD immunoglobulin-like domain containing protein, partial [Fidelibacterota bacterium]